jgi:ATP-dependent protease Clp ATPase subunit
MMKCSFCDKDETQVAKLVAGPTVFICDKCVEIAYRIMREDGAVGQSFWSRIRHRSRRRRNTPPRRLEFREAEL